MYLESFIKIMEQTPEKNWRHTTSDPSNEPISRLCHESICTGISCEDCPFDSVENLTAFSKELKEKAFPVIQLQNLIEE